MSTAYRQGMGRWTGCDWPTALGRLGLNLDGLTSTHATLMARATSGREATDWRAAARWLTEVEEAARQAEYEAQLAMHLATSGRLPDAFRHAERAVDIASAYQRSFVWEPLRAAIDDLLKTDRSQEQPEIREDGLSRPSRPVCRQAGGPKGPSYVRNSSAGQYRGGEDGPTNRDNLQEPSAGIE